MPVLPIPMIVALLLAGLLIKRLVGRDTHVTLLALIAVCVLQSAIMALVQYYGLTSIRPLQPLVAMVIPPVAWFAFARASGAESEGRAWLLHGLGPALALLSLILAPALLDGLIPLSFTAYGAAILLRLRPGEVSLPHSRLQGEALPLQAWRIIGLSLIASAASDVAIAVSLSRGMTGMLFWLPSLLSSLSILSLCVLSLSSAMESPRDQEQGGRDMLPDVDSERHQSTIDKLQSYLAAHKPFKDPDLTLDRLSRKLLVPAKQLSAAINRSTGENVSRYINRHRIEEACLLLLAGQSVTSAMLESGFNTKSNFNREFRRVTGESPSDWLKCQKLSTNGEAGTAGSATKRIA
jgi:AraC-like DNA-binding protein